MLILLSHLSRRSRSLSQPGPPTGLIPCATPVFHNPRARTPPRRSPYWSGPTLPRYALLAAPTPLPSPTSSPV